MVSALFANADWTGLLFMFSDPFPTNATKVLLYHIRYVTTICLYLLCLIIKDIFLQKHEVKYFRNYK